MYQYRGTIVEIKDGDTVVVDVDLGFTIHQIMILRLFGINTPEVIGTEKAKGLLSKAYVQEKIPAGTKVIVETIKDKKEKYGRYLANIILEDGTILNDILIEKGLATAYFGVGPKT